MTKSLKKKIVSGFLWQALDRVGTQGLQFVILVILARLLMPETFGVIAIMTACIALCQVFVDSGFGTALIQKKDADDLDCNSVFYINIAMALIIYGALFFLSPLIADFYNTPDIALYLRVLSLMIVLRSFALVHTALLSKRMLFYLNCRISWVAVFISGLVGIIMAYNKFGIWSLITQQLLNAFITSVLQYSWVKWKPALQFNWQRAKNLFRFGWKIFCSALLDTFYNELYTILIGKLFNLKTLSFYQQGRTIPTQGMALLNMTMSSVLLPAFSTLQDDRTEMKLLAQKTLKITSFLLVPLLSVLLITARPLVLVLFSQTWEPCIIFLQLSCFIVFFYPFHTLNLQIITACGRSDIFLILEIVKKVQVVIMILITYRYGVLAMVYGMIACAPLAFIENSFCNKKLIDYAWYKQFKDMLPAVLTGAIAAAAGWYIMKLTGNNWIKLFSGAITTGIIYLIISILCNLIPPELYQILQTHFNIRRQANGR